MIVLKFGGTSVKDAQAILKTINIIKRKEKPIITVVSAMSGITNSLVKIIEELNNSNLNEVIKIIENIFTRHLNTAKDLGVLNETKKYLTSQKNELVQLVKALDILGEVTPKSKDNILSRGELLSSYLIYHTLNKQPNSCNLIDARDIIKTDKNYTEANVNFTDTKKAVKKHLTEVIKDSDIIITQGFIASDKQGNTTTLGRGGSDYSASILASLLSASALEIWTDVDGILTCDPRMVNNAKLINELSYSEASELSFFGAKVLHPKTIYPAVMANIPVMVLNTFNPEYSGTKILPGKGKKKMLKAIAFRKGNIVINIQSNRMLGAYGFLARVFDIFGKYETSVDLVATSEVCISLTIDDDKYLKEIKSELKKFASVDIRKNQSIISAVGEGIRDTAGIAAKFFNVLKGINITMVSIGASEVNLSILVDDSDLESAVKLLHDAFFSHTTDYEVFRENK